MSDRIHVKPNSAWKTVNIDPNLFSKQDLDGFISLQELTHYEVVTGTDKMEDSTRKAKPKKMRKKKESTQFGNAAIVADNTEKEDTLHSDLDKRTKPKKNRKKKQQSCDVNVVPSKIVGVGHELENEGTVHSIAEKQTKLKKHKKKLRQSCDVNSKVVDVGQELERTEMQTNPHVKAKKRKRPQIADDPPQSKKRRRDRGAEDSTSSTPAAGDVPRTTDTNDMVAWKDMFVPDEVLQALREQGFHEPTPIQAQVLAPAIRDHMDIVGAAETGSGKTLAFGIPVLHYILEHRRRQAESAAAGLAYMDNVGSDDDDDISGLVGTTDDDSDDGHDDDVDDDVESDGEESGDEDDEANSDLGSDESAEEELEQMSDTEHDTGCVKVIKDADFSWLETAPPTGAARPRGQPHPFALILEPTRELAVQVKNHLTAAAKYTDIKIAVIVGGLSMQKQRRILKRCPDIIVATPGRLWELIQEGTSYLAEVDKVRHLVVDEADRMVEKGHFEELAKLLQHLNVDAKKKARRHTYIFSATLTVVHSGPQRMLKKKKVKLDEKQKLAVLMECIGLKERPKVVDITRKVATVETLTEARINCSKDEKDVYLYYFLKQFPGRTLIFTNSKDCIRRLVSVFALLQCCPLPLHADMHQKQRLKNLERFTANPRGVLIASDVAARGLDIPNVQHVLHYQVPYTVENYVHRSGRTARASKEGLSLMIVGPDDVKNYRKIMHSLNKNDEIPLLPIDAEYFQEVRTRVNMVRDIETTEYRFQKSKRQNDWFTKSAEEVGLVLDDTDKLLNDLGDSEQQAQHRAYMKQMKAELNVLLRMPIAPRTLTGKYPTKSGQLATLPDSGQDRDAISSVKKDKKWQQKMMARSRNRPPPTMKLKKSKWKKKKKV